MSQLYQCHRSAPISSEYLLSIFAIHLKIIPIIANTFGLKILLTKVVSAEKTEVHSKFVLNNIVLTLYHWAKKPLLLQQIHNELSVVFLSTAFTYCDSGYCDNLFDILALLIHNSPDQFLQRTTDWSEGIAALYSAYRSNEGKRENIVRTLSLLAYSTEGATNIVKQFGLELFWNILNENNEFCKIKYYALITLVNITHLLPNQLLTEQHINILINYLNQDGIENYKINVLILFSNLSQHHENHLIIFTQTLISKLLSIFHLSTNSVSQLALAVLLSQGLLNTNICCHLSLHRNNLLDFIDKLAGTSNFAAFQLMNQAVDQAITQPQVRPSPVSIFNRGQQSPQQGREAEPTPSPSNSGA